MSNQYKLFTTLIVYDSLDEKVASRQTKLAVWISVEAIQLCVL